MAYPRIIGASLLLVASLLGCTSPKKGTTLPDAADQTGEPDAGTAETGGLVPDVPGAGADAPGAGSDVPGAGSDVPGAGSEVGSDVPLAVDLSGPDQGPGDARDAAAAETTMPPPDAPCGSPTDPRNCGTCGHDCTKLANVAMTAMVTCQAGACVVPAGACASGYGHCSANPDDGCEASLSRTETCGGCNTRCAAGDLCASAGGSFQCVSGCSASTPDKCGTTCTDLRSDPRNCSTCGKDCTQLPNVRPGGPVSCQSGTCAIGSGACAAGYGDCNGSPADGCETNLSLAATCGGCNTSCSAGKVCAPSGQTYACACAASTPDTCSGQCTNLQTDSRNCGICGRDCSQLPNVMAGASVSCSGGNCVIPASSCVSPYGHCGAGPPNNGCETNISLNSSCNCTACTGGQTCQPSGGSYACACGGATPTKCGNSCVNLQSDGQNCGTCGKSCLGGVCSSGVCQPVQLYSGNTWAMLAHNGYLYFKKEKSTNITILARIRQDGMDYGELTSVNLGGFLLTDLAVANNNIYWSGDSNIRHCALPTCSGGIQNDAMQIEPRDLFSNTSQTQLFWNAKNQSMVTQTQLFTSPASPTGSPVVTSDVGGRGTADGTWVYFSDFASSDGSTIWKAPVGGGGRTMVGPGCCDLFMGPSDIISHGTGDASTGFAFVVYKTPKTGGSRTVVGYKPNKSYSLWGGMFIQGSDVYWQFGTGDDIGLHRCPISGCSTNPTDVIPYTNVYGYQPQGVYVDSTAVYFATELGIYRLAR